MHTQCTVHCTITTHLTILYCTASWSMVSGCCINLQSSVEQTLKHCNSIEAQMQSKQCHPEAVHCSAIESWISICTACQWIALWWCGVAESLYWVSLHVRHCTGTSARGPTAPPLGLLTPHVGPLTPPLGPLTPHAPHTYLSGPPNSSCPPHLSLWAP